MTETALSPAAQDVLDAFAPAPSLADVLDPTAEAKGRAVAAGVEDATPRAMPAELVAGGTSWVWVVLGATRSTPFVALVSADERRAWEVSRDCLRLCDGVRVERHPLI